MASTCDNCNKGSILPGEPKGTIDPSTGAYLAKAPDQARTERVVVLLTDAFGLPLKNSKIIADVISEQLGCDVWIPDIFDGRPLFAVGELTQHLPQHAGEKMTWGAIFKVVSLIFRRLPNVIHSRPSLVDARIDTFLQGLRSSENKYQKIGAVGYCFGGSAVIRLGGRGLVNSIAICHPGGFTNAQVRTISVPNSWVCAEEDMFVTPKMRAAAENEFAGRKDKDSYVDYEFRVYPGTTHGFAARPDLAYPDVKEAYERALDQVVEWFKKTLTL